MKCKWLNIYHSTHCSTCGHRSVRKRDFCERQPVPLFKFDVWTEQAGGSVLLNIGYQRWKLTTANWRSTLLRRASTLLMALKISTIGTVKDHSLNFRRQSRPNKCKFTVACLSHSTCPNLPVHVLRYVRMGHPLNFFFSLTLED